MSIKKSIYIAVRDRILTNTAVKTSRLYNSQFVNMTEENTFAFPAAFIEFSELTYGSISEGSQDGNLKIRVYLGFDSLKTEDLALLDLMEAVNAALQGFAPVNGATPLNRVFEAQDINHDAVRVWLMDYETRFRDNSGHRNNKLIETTLTQLELLDDHDAPRLKEI